MCCGGDTFLAQEEGPLILGIFKPCLNSSLEKLFVIIKTNILFILIFLFIFNIIMGNDIFGSFDKKCCGGDKISFEMYILNNH